MHTEQAIYEVRQICRLGKHCLNKNLCKQSKSILQIINQTVFHKFALI